MNSTLKVLSRALVERRAMIDPSQYDHSQHRAIRLQSSALVLAALITTAGAVSSAFIQSGWFGKPAASAVVASAHQVTPKPLASFVGTIEPMAEMPIAASGAMPPPAFSATSRPAPAATEDRLAAANGRYTGVVPGQSGG